MGLRVALFALGFNALQWLSRVTLGLYLARHGSPAAGFAAGLVAPTALLAIGARVTPSLRAALVLVAGISVAAAGLIGVP
jgi:hypothetical protein